MKATAFSQKFCQFLQHCLDQDQDLFGMLRLLINILMRKFNMLDVSVKIFINCQYQQHCRDQDLGLFIMLRLLINILIRSINMLDVSVKISQHFCQYPQHCAVQDQDLFSMLILLINILIRSINMLDVSVKIFSTFLSIPATLSRPSSRLRGCHQFFFNMLRTRFCSRSKSSYRVSACWKAQA
jgi:hypothetical protein